MGLDQYHEKRNFSKTSEPKGNIKQTQTFLFVIQKHDASHLHYDFRLELKGVLKSWAIPKGPCLDPKIKRLAIHVEDHPIEYSSFEGIIPQSEYGGGTVMLWDSGTWEPLDENPLKAYKKGHLRFNLKGKKLNGRWDLIQFKDNKHWFLIKYADDFARPLSQYDITLKLDRSVVSDGTIEDITAHYEQASNKHPTPKKATITKLIKQPTLNLIKNLKKTPFPQFIRPQLATLVDKPPKGDQWLHEVKFDGYRILSYKNNHSVVLKSRNNQEWTKEFQTIADAVFTLPFDQFILDGEVAALDEKGRSDFQLLQNSFQNQELSLVYFVFDLLYLDGYDLRTLSLVERKSILKNIMTNASLPLHYSNHIINAGQEMFQHSCQYALEGIISKRTDSAYYSKRSKEWLKIKCINRQEFVIGGYTPPKGGRAHFGSLFLGVYNKDGNLDYVGNVGTGFSNKTIAEIYQHLIKNQTHNNPFGSNPPGVKQAHWVLPSLVCEVEFTQWTKEGHLRHPSFKGLRFDKKAIEVTREHSIPLKKIAKDAVSPPKKSKLVSESVDNSSLKSILTHPDKILYPEDKITKQDLLTYYEAVSSYILPFIALRPLTLLRCPSNYHQCFYQRHYNNTTPKALHSIDLSIDSGSEQYLYLKDKKGLLSLVQMDVLEIHPWGSHINHLEQPDVIVIDLDPAPDLSWKQVVESALEIRYHLEQYHLTSFVKSTGGKGLHVVVPILPEYDWEQVKQFTHLFVQFLEKLNPKKYISTMSKAKRKGKIFVDYLRNQRTATAIGVYSTRARVHAPVSTPLAWEELSDHIEDNTYTIKTLPKRLLELKKDPWATFGTIKQSLRIDDL